MGLLVKNIPRVSGDTPWSTKNWMMGCTSFLKSSVITQGCTFPFLSQSWIDTPSLTIFWSNSDLLTKEAKLKLGVTIGTTPSKLGSTSNGLFLSCGGIIFIFPSKTSLTDLFVERILWFFGILETRSFSSTKSALFLLEIFLNKNFMFLNCRHCRNIF